MQFCSLELVATRYPWDHMPADLVYEMYFWKSQHDASQTVPIQFTLCWLPSWYTNRPWLVAPNQESPVESFVCSKETKTKVSVIGVRSSVLQKYPNNYFYRQQKPCPFRNELTKKCMHVSHIKIWYSFHLFSEDPLILSAVCTIRCYFTLVFQKSHWRTFHCWQIWEVSPI